MTSKLTSLIFFRRNFFQAIRPRKRTHLSFWPSLAKRILKKRHLYKSDCCFQRQCDLSSCERLFKRAGHLRCGNKTTAANQLHCTACLSGQHGSPCRTGCPTHNCRGRSKATPVWRVILYVRKDTDSGHCSSCVRIAQSSCADQRWSVLCHPGSFAVPRHCHQAETNTWCTSSLGIHSGRDNPRNYLGHSRQHNRDLLDLRAN